MLRSIDISDYMTKKPVTVLDDDRLSDAIETITNNRLSGVCVINRSDDLVGVLSEMDCLRAIVSATYNQDGDIGKVHEFMTAEVQCCSLHDNIVDVALDMIAKGHRRRPVVQDGKLIGQITCRQILRVVRSFRN